MKSAKMTLKELITRGLGALTSEDPEAESLALLNEVRTTAHKKLAADGRRIKDEREGIVETSGEESNEHAAE